MQPAIPMTQGGDSMPPYYSADNNDGVLINGGGQVNARPRVSLVPATDPAGSPGVVILGSSPADGLAFWGGKDGKGSFLRTHTAAEPAFNAVNPIVQAFSATVTQAEGNALLASINTRLATIDGNNTSTSALSTIVNGLRNIMDAYNFIIKAP